MSNTSKQLMAVLPSPELTTQLSNLQIAAATLSRKQTNFQLAEDLLIRQITLLSSSDDDDGGAPPHSDLLPSLTFLLKRRDSLELLDVMRVERESAKLLYALNQPRTALDILSSSVAMCLSVTDNPAVNGVIRQTRQSCGELCSRSLMTLTKWLQADSKVLSGVGADGFRPPGTEQGLLESAMANIKLLLDLEARNAKQQPGRLLASIAGGGGLL